MVWWTYHTSIIGTWCLTYLAHHLPSSEFGRKSTINQVRIHTWRWSSGLYILLRKSWLEKGGTNLQTILTIKIVSKGLHKATSALNPPQLNRDLFSLLSKDSNVAAWLVDLIKAIESKSDRCTCQLWSRSLTAWCEQAVIGTVEKAVIAVTSTGRLVGRFYKVSTLPLPNHGSSSDYCGNGRFLLEEGLATAGIVTIKGQGIIFWTESCGRTTAAS